MTPRPSPGQPFSRLPWAGVWVWRWWCSWCCVWGATAAVAALPSMSTPPATSTGSQYNATRRAKPTTLSVGTTPSVAVGPASGAPWDSNPKSAETVETVLDRTTLRFKILALRDYIAHLYDDGRQCVVVFFKRNFYSCYHNHISISFYIVPPLELASLIFYLTDT